MTKIRQFTPLEINHLNRYGHRKIDYKNLGEKPVEYITNIAEFHHLSFYVNQNVLIPRIESEKIIDLALTFAKENFDVSTQLSVADICCGSGCLGISFFLALKDAGFTKVELILTDISTKALDVTKMNCQKLLPFDANYSILESDMLTNLPETSKFDILLSNPPYIPSDRISKLDSSVKDFEPHLALDGGPLGNTLINKLIAQLPKHVQKSSISIIEIDYLHNMKAFTLPNVFDVEILKDDSGLNRYLVLTPTQDK